MGTREKRRTIYTLLGIRGCRLKTGVQTNIRTRSEVIQ
jgi:hypothetical protein